MEIQKLFDQLEFELFKIAFLTAFLDSVLLFLIVSTIFSMANFSPFISLAIALIFFTIKLIHTLKRTPLKKVEEKNPSLTEILRTAKDNLGNDAFMVKAMNEDLLERMNHVYMGSMVKYKRLFIQTLLIFLIGFAAVFVAAHNTYVVDYEDVAKSIDTGSIGKFFSNSINAIGSGKIEEIPEIIFNQTEDIYGDPEVAQLGDQALNIMIQENLNSIDLNEEVPLETNEFTTQEYAYDVGGSMDVQGTDRLTQEYKYINKVEEELRRRGQK